MMIDGSGSDLLAARFRQVDEIVGMDLPDPGQDHLTCVAAGSYVIDADIVRKLGETHIETMFPLPGSIMPLDYTARVEAMRFALQSMPADPGRARDISEIMKRARDIHQFFVETHPGEGSRQTREATPG